MWARIENSEVKEITDIDPTERFHPSLIWVICPVGTTQGMVYENGEFSPAPEIVE